MNAEEQDAAFSYMELCEAIWPHGRRPGSFPGGSVTFVTEEAWNNYRYNPNLYFNLPYDLDASPKPSWGGIVEASKLGMQIRRLRHIQNRRTNECKKRIRFIFTQDRRSSLETEMFVRLNGGNTLENLALRQQILDRNEILKIWIASLFYNELLTLDVTDDQYWSSEWSLPLDD